ncbi:MAG: hypothetical protein LBS89_03885, partial [Zoogloeaceae bacterium]|nr:hypothetical protein [Zoogloeaceae bacterium]
ATFAVFGIFGAWASVVLFYPALLPATLPLPKRAGAVARLLQYWPQWRGTRWQWGGVLLLGLLLGGGLLQLRADDDIKTLFNGDAALIAEQREVSEILQLPSPAQMFLIRARSEEELLIAEERLTARLRPLMAAGQLSGFEAVSRWLPSKERQSEIQSAQKKLQASREALEKELELPAGWARDSSPKILTPKDWLASPLSQPLRALWLGEREGGHASMVLLKGLADPQTTATLAALAEEFSAVCGVNVVCPPAPIVCGVNAVCAPSPDKGRVGEGFGAVQPETTPGMNSRVQNPPQSPLVRGEAALQDVGAGNEAVAAAEKTAFVDWIDQPREISRLMQSYRHLLTKTLLAACLLAPLLLYVFFRKAVWRIITPVLVAGLATLAIMGYLHIPVQLLSILALLLTIGMGVDYAIFLQARQTHAHTLLATTLAAALTLLSFGLLALSTTPALRALGLTATLGVTFSWLLTPMFAAATTKTVS